MNDFTPLVKSDERILDINRTRLPENQKRIEFKELERLAHDSLKLGINPKLISEGSSGSYFVYDKNNKIIGIFKPKNEEPYGKLNPKWLKWLHRIFFPCCFGRSCIIPNKGYLSEAGAYLVDYHLGLNVVPATFITYLVSPTFNYSRLDRSASEARKFLKSKFNILSKINSNLPAKIGSFQKYVDGYNNGVSLIYKMENNSIDDNCQQEFHYLLEKMVVLDYIIRNTDRSNNWLMKIDEIPISTFNNGIITESIKFNFHLAAIDNGLAFPFKHPDSWRSYPFDWSFFKFAKKSFSQQIKDLILPKLTDCVFVENLVNDLEILFKIDKGFDENRFSDQMAVMRGQIHNLVNALSEEKTTPSNLIEMNPIYIYKCPESSQHEYTHIIHDRRPFFKRF